jgi:SAM-dependent methyltransferase
VRSVEPSICPRCCGVILTVGNELSCADCGLWSRSVAPRLWWAAEDMIPNGFDAFAAGRLADMVTLDHFWLRERRNLVGRLMRRLAGAREKGWSSALELGCGPGLMLPLLEEKVDDVTAIEAHRLLLEQAHANSSCTNLFQGDVTDTLMREGRFDLIAAFDVIEHVDADAFLAEARRLARTGCDLLVSAPAFPSLWSALDARAGHRCRYRWRKLRFELERNGRRPAGHTHFQFLLYPLVYASRCLKRNKSLHFERQPPHAADCLLGAINRVEVSLLSRFRLPFGSSLFAWARAEG